MSNTPADEMGFNELAEVVRLYARVRNVTEFSDDALATAIATLERFAVGLEHFTDMLRVVQYARTQSAEAAEG